MKNYIIFLFVITLIGSCADDDEQYRMECNYKLTGLELRNDILKQELDSIKSIIKNENISVLTFANTMSGNIIANDSAEFLVSIAYERPSLVRKMTYSISQNIDSIDHYLNNSNYQMNVI